MGMNGTLRVSIQGLLFSLSPCGLRLEKASVMKKTSVSLLVTSPSMSLDELSSKLGRAPSSGSYSKGDAFTG